MSRAFVKETEDVEDLPDRPISDLPNDVTAEGFRRIEEALAAAQGLLRKRRGIGTPWRPPAAISAIGARVAPRRR